MAATPERVPGATFIRGASKGARGLVFPEEELAAVGRN